MGARKCVVTGCNSSPGASYHKFPSKREFRENWLTAMKSEISPALLPSSSHLICSQHFQKEDFQEIKGNARHLKILKQGVVPTVFPWQGPEGDVQPAEELKMDIKIEVDTAETEVAANESVPAVPASPVVSKPCVQPSSSKSNRSTRSKNSKRKKDDADLERQVEEKIEAIKAEIAAIEKPSQSGGETRRSSSETQKSIKVEPSTVAPATSTSSNIPTTSALLAMLTKKPKKKVAKASKKSKTSFSRLLGKKVRVKKPGKKSSAPKPKHKAVVHMSPSPKKPTKLNLVFSPGAKLEAQDFDGKWHEAKMVEVDSDEREVLIHFDKNEKLSDEWIPMDSVRLRPVSVVKKLELFVVGEKCMARWNDSRKFPATIQKIVDDGKAC